ncbi:hypothetical protein BDZ97DRAFT_552337 [Flammula alnicola]|nr:hypothetical protein BDZ97DRAFT_552337 [Flammula alnicola]
MLNSRPVQLATDGAYFPTKTPGRGLKNRIENAHAGGGVAVTVNGKGKNVNVAPRTPFQPASVQPHKFKDQKTVLTTIIRPLGDKTPLPNRLGNVLFQTPLPGMSKLSKLGQFAENGYEGEGGTPDSVQRPSSMRKHIKHPRNSGKHSKHPSTTAITGTLATVILCLILSLFSKSQFQRAKMTWMKSSTDHQIPLICPMNHLST